MRILFFGFPAHGHTNPTLPVVEELVRRGDEALYWNSVEFRPQIERTGASFIPYPSDSVSPVQIAAELRQGNLSNISLLTLQTSAHLLPLLLETVPALAPDVVIFDSLAVWGRMTATILRLPAVAAITHLIFDEKRVSVSKMEFLKVLWQGASNLPRLIYARNHLIRQFGKYAFPPIPPLFPMRGEMNLVFTSREFHPDCSLIDNSFRFIGPAVNPRTRDTDPLPEIPASGTIVYISLGTLHQANTMFFQDCLNTLSNYPAHFVLSTGGRVPVATLGEIPANFTVRDFVPQLDVLQRADAFITHGGLNSVHESLYFGVPMILAPQQFEQLLNAGLVAASGAGILLRGAPGNGAFLAENLRPALDRVLNLSHYREAASVMGQSLRAAGGFSRAADEIQHFMNKKSGVIEINHPAA